MDLSKEKILIGTSTFAAKCPAPLERLKQAGCEVTLNPYKRKLTKEEITELLAEGITGLIAGLEPLDRQILEKARLKVISRCGSGHSNVDLKAAEELGIKVCYTPEAPVEAVAELTLGAMLNLLRFINKMDSDLHKGTWNKIVGAELKGKTVLIIGFGRIGRRLAELLKPFHLRIVVADPNLEQKINGVEILPLAEALPKADIISLHCSGQEEIIGQKEFDLIKPETFLLNASRGGLINEEALIKALEEKKIKGAWLDTFNSEPYSGALKEYEQVILTPHAGSYTLECRKTMEMRAVNNLISAFKEFKQ